MAPGITKNVKHAASGPARNTSTPAAPGHWTVPPHVDRDTIFDPMLIERNE